MRGRGAVLALILMVSPAQAEKLLLSVARAQAAFDPRTTVPVITVTLKPESARAFFIFTQANVGRRIDISVGGKVMSSPILREPIPGGTLQISGDFSAAQTTALAKDLTAGTATLEVEAAP